MLADENESFNSLSRDHVFVHGVGPTLQSNFQLPLSGSPQGLHGTPDYLGRFQLPLSGSQAKEAAFVCSEHKGLSTPSLGITGANENFAPRISATSLSTPSLGITFWG